MSPNEWLCFLQSWESRVRAKASESAEDWREMGFPDLDAYEFFVQPYGSTGLTAEMATRAGVEELLSFYAATNGWPLFIGEDLIEISGIENINWFAKIGGKNFNIAVSQAPSDTESVSNRRQVSALELNTAILLSKPTSARELVLWLESGEICLYMFEDRMRFESLSSFLKFVLNWLEQELNESR